MMPLRQRSPRRHSGHAGPGRDGDVPGGQCRVAGLGRDRL